MARKTVSDEHSRDAKFGKTIERFKSELATAKSHSIGRDRRVGQVMCYLSLMKSAGMIDGQAILTCKGAARQHFKSSRAEGKQAAHYLPGQLRINSRFPWIFLTNPRAALQLEGLFGDVEDLPANFNKADSAAEAYRSVDGLKGSFARSCKIVVTDTQPVAGGLVDRAVVQRAFKDWTIRSRKAYETALAKKEAKVNVPPLKVGIGQAWGERDPKNLQERFEAMSRDHNYIEQVRFLKAYLAIARPGNLTGALINGVEKTFGQ